VDARVQKEKEDAARTCSKVKCYCKNAHTQRTLGQADAPLNSKSWTKTGRGIIGDCKRGLSKPKKVHGSAIRMKSGRLSQGHEEWLQAFADDSGRIFNTPLRVDRRVLSRLAPCCACPSRKPPHPAGGAHSGPPAQALSQQGG
jgi:hypothetical protein